MWRWASYLASDMLFASESSGDFISALLSSCRLVLKNKWLYAKMVWKPKGLFSVSGVISLGVLVLILVWSCFYRQPESWTHWSLVTVGTSYFIFLLPASDQSLWLHIHVTEHLPLWPSFHIHTLVWLVPDILVLVWFTLSFPLKHS